MKNTKQINFSNNENTKVDQQKVQNLLSRLQKKFPKGKGAWLQIETLKKFLMQVDYNTDVLQEPIETLSYGQTREKDVDTAKAKSLQFGFDEPLDVPLFWYRDSITGEKKVLFGNHRLWKGKEHLGAESMPCVEITFATTGMSSNLLGALGKWHNSKSRKENESSLEEDSRATYQATRQWMLEDEEYGKITSKSEVKRILSDKELLKTEHPRLWKAIRNFADISLVNSRSEIINHMLSNNDSHRPYILGKSDAVYNVLENVYGKGNVSKKNQYIFSPHFNSGIQTCLTLADGGQQQEQSEGGRIQRKRIAGEVVIPVINGVGNSKSQVIKSRMRAFELMLVRMHFDGPEQGIRSLRKIYKDGLVTFPNFREGLEDTAVVTGKNKYKVSIEPERADSYACFKIHRIEEVVARLREVYSREQSSFEETGEVKFSSFPMELVDYIFPTFKSLELDEGKKSIRTKKTVLRKRAMKKNG